MTHEGVSESAGVAIRRLMIGREPGVVVELLDLGATVAKVEVTGGDGLRRNVVLGHADPSGYVGTGSYLGATVGRYANRIAGGRFELEGTEVVVGTHDRGNHLHGGPDGFDQRTWEVVHADERRVTFALTSPDGDQGFPGTLRAEATYEVSDDEVSVRFTATTDRTTVVNLTQHSYFNLDGDASGTVEDHELVLEADSFTPVDATGIPEGGHAPVDGTPFDLRSATRLGPVVREPHPQVVMAQGIDHNFVVRGEGWRRAAMLTSHASRTRLELFTDQPGLQVYTGNFLDGTETGTSGSLYRQGDGIALEPQVFPDSPNRREFPSPTLDPGEVYRASLAWRFSVIGGQG